MHVIIVGAGIAGLSAGIGLRRAGHRVTILEQSSLRHETGAAITITPNASRVLQSWGFQPKDSKMVIISSGSIENGATMESTRANYFTDTREEYGIPLYSAHRVDLHNQLIDLATRKDGLGQPVIIQTGSKVKDYDAAQGKVTLENQVLQADLIVAADGVHSSAVEHVLNAKDDRASDTAWGAMRWLVPTEDLLADPETADLVHESKQRYFTGSRGTGALVWYPCRNNEVQNFLYLSQSFELLNATEDYRAGVDPRYVKDHAEKDFHPKLQAVIGKAKEVKFWKLVSRKPIPVWHKGRLLLIGDAAHPMLTFLAQAGGQAIEDGGALSVLFEGFTWTAESLEARLQLFEEVRRNRGSSLQTLSSSPQPQSQTVRDAAATYIPGNKRFENPADVSKYIFSFDVIKEARQLLA